MMMMLLSCCRLWWCLLVVVVSSSWCILACCTVVALSPSSDQSRRTCAAVAVVKTFQEKIDEKRFDQAGLLINENAIITTPFGKKSKDHFLKRLQSRNGPIWGSPSCMGENENQCVTEGTRKFGFFNVKLTRVVDIDENNMINRITVTMKK